MITENTIISKLKKHQSPTQSMWRENAINRMENKTMLQYTRHMTMIILDEMENKHISMEQLENQIGCDQQCLESILKGKEMLTPEIRDKIQTFLNINIEY